MASPRRSAGAKPPGHLPAPPALWPVLRPVLPALAACRPALPGQRPGQGSPRPLPGLFFLDPGNEENPSVPWVRLGCSSLPWGQRASSGPMASSMGWPLSLWPHCLYVLGLWPAPGPPGPAPPRRPGFRRLLRLRCTLTCLRPWPCRGPGTRPSWADGLAGLALAGRGPDPGALLFALSDSILALDTFVSPVPAGRAVIMTTYYAASASWPSRWWSAATRAPRRTERGMGPHEVTTVAPSGVPNSGRSPPTRLTSLRPRRPLLLTGHLGLRLLQ
ncbi:lysoplasmalogenase [Ornithorhynchus anatinus]|uniref:lysoplasmalogenase n=1 Tax=Ornithorhynchus anatinus TaxID=9258 RepID=UPI0019D44E47|nr:lysoplasmalogenase [Ornithorhynchus anatinus]